DRRLRLGVVRGLVHRDPVLAEVDTGDLVREEGLADVGPDVADAGDRGDRALLGGDDTSLLRERRSRLRDDMAEKVALLELRDQRLAEERDDCRSRCKRDPD